MDLKLQLTLSKFEDLRMLESETFSVFYEKVEMLTNEALGLGKPINETTIVQKILRTLPKRFEAKNVVIQEFKDLNKIKLGKVVGKLITYEMKLDLDKGESKKRKEVALQSVDKSKTIDESCDQSPDEDLALFVKQFRRILKNKGKDDKRVRESSNNSFGQHHDKLTSGLNQGRFIYKRYKSSPSVLGPCFECGKRGHHVAECVNNKMSSQKHDKAIMSTWSDSEDEDSVCFD
ncbi:uncharacterized protein [Malus domestica]|uniref:uncharacterized protein n=1 Tax=Malus domestica TaxID=3750 RepID=UPI003974A9D1